MDRSFGTSRNYGLALELLVEHEYVDCVTAVVLSHVNKTLNEQCSPKINSITRYFGIVSISCVWCYMTIIAKNEPSIKIMKKLKEKYQCSCRPTHDNSAWILLTANRQGSPTLPRSIFDDVNSILCRHPDLDICSFSFNGLSGRLLTHLPIGEYSRKISVILDQKYPDVDAEDEILKIKSLYHGTFTLHEFLTHHGIGGMLI